MEALVQVRGRPDTLRDMEPVMAFFMVPGYLEIVDALPKTLTGKIRKHVLREKEVTRASRGRVAEQNDQGVDRSI